MKDRKFVPVYIKLNPKTKQFSTILPITFKKICVPAPYKLNWLLRYVYRHSPYCLRAAIVYSFICKSGWNNLISKQLKAAYFYKVMRLDGVNSVKARIYWLTVRAYSILTFKK